MIGFWLVLYTSSQGVGSVAQQIEAMQQFHAVVG